MNLNFIGKEFDRLADLEDFINYEYEPKSNKKVGKRNIYYEDIKLDFINEVNTYGFSPFILKNFSDQRDDPNIMRFMTKNFNHGLTNYIKLENRSIAHHTTKEIKKYISKKKKFKKNKKKKDIYSNIFLIKKNEDKKKDEVKENFLQKALLEVGGNKLNLSMDDEDEKEGNKDKENEDKTKKGKTNTSNSNKLDLKKKELSKDQKELILKEKEILEKKQEEKNIELLKKYIGVNKGKYAIGKNDMQQLPNLFSNNNTKPNTLKLIFQNKGYNNKILNINKDLANDVEFNKKILTLSKNKDLLSDKRDYIFRRIFSPGNRSGNTKGNTTGNEGRHSLKAETKSNYNKRLNGKKQLKDEFLLFAKARPYRYLTVENE